MEHLRRKPEDNKQNYQYPALQNALMEASVSGSVGVWFRSAYPVAPPWPHDALGSGRQCWAQEPVLACSAENMRSRAVP